MTGLDTSVVVRLLVGEPSEQAEHAREFLDGLFEQGEKAAISDLVVSEVYFALQYHYGVPKAKAIEALRTFLESPEIRSAGSAALVLQTKNLERVKPGFVDRLIYHDYAQMGAPMATFEKQARRLEKVIVL